MLFYITYLCMYVMVSLCMYDMWASTCCMYVMLCMYGMLCAFGTYGRVNVWVDIRWMDGCVCICVCTV